MKYFQSLAVLAALFGCTEAAKLRTFETAEAGVQGCATDYTIKAISSEDEYDCDHATTRFYDQDKHADDIWCQGNAASDFKDPSFPAANSSLFYDSDSDDNQAQTYKKYQKGKWNTIRAMNKSWVANGNNSLWGKNGVQPAGINQGGLGDCWFLSSAASLAEKPERIMNLFKNKELSKSGIYQVTLYVKGEPVVVTVDDQLPIYSWGMTFDANQSKNGAWWAPILEKAYSKLALNYGQLNGGIQNEAFNVLTGQPTNAYMSYNLTTDQVWDITTEADANGWIMAGSSQTTQENLVSGHAYSLIGARELKDNTGKVIHKLIEMRNPWGHEQYNGPWSDTDTAWTEDFRKQANFPKGETYGRFFVNLDDYTDLFCDLRVGMVQDNWIKSSQDGKAQGSGGAGWIQVDNPKDQDVTFVCFQFEARMYSDFCESDMAPMYYYMNLYHSYFTKGSGECSSDYGNGGFTVKGLKKGSYQLGVFNYDDDADWKTSNFTITSFVTGDEVKLGPGKAPWA